MKSQINALRQLQELVLTRDEHHQTGDGSHLDALNDSIDILQQKLEPQIAGLYERLYKKSHIVISAMTNKCCSVCGMQVPIAQGQQVRPLIQQLFMQRHEVLLVGGLGFHHALEIKAVLQSEN